MKRSVTAEWLLLVILSALLVVAGLLFSRHLLVVLALPPLCIATVAILSPFELPNLTVTRSAHPALMEEGQATEVLLVATNSGRAPCHLSLAEQGAGELAPEGTVALRGLLAPGESAELRYRLAPRRGLYRLGAIELQVSDELGMRVANRRAEVRTELIVWPKSERLRGAALPEATRYPLMRIGRTPASVPGSGTEWLGVRGYSPGDPLRRINWRAWARTQQPFTNEFSSDRSVDAWVVLDARQRTELRIGEDSLFERSVSAAASLCRDLLASGNRVALLVYGGVIDFVPLGSGARQLERLMTRLAAVRLAAHLAFTTFANLPTRLFRPQQELFVVTPLVEGDAERVVALAGAGHHLTILSPNPIAFEEASVRVDAAGEAAWRMGRLEREATLLMLVRAGCRVIDWKPGELLAASLPREARRVP